MHALIFNENEPTSSYTGRIWIKPSTMTAYIKLGSSWITLGSGIITDTITFGKLTLLIDNIDKTNLVEMNSISIEDILTKEVNTCSFVLNDTSITSENKPNVGQEVQIYYKETAISDPILIFGGRIIDIPQTKLGLQMYQYEVNCADYTQDLQRNQVVENYTSQTAGYIIKDIINNYAKNIGTYYVEDGITIEYISFNYRFPLECIGEICQLTGYDYYVDYEKNLHFFNASTNSAPYSLTDDLSTGQYLNLNIKVDKSQLKNKQIIRGGYHLSNLFTEEQVADGTQDSYNLKYEPYTPISVYVDTGGGYVAKTLGIDNIDSTGYDFVVNVNEKNIKNLDLATLSAGHKIKITYTYKIPVLAQAEDQISIDMMINYEGGDGIYEGELIVDETIETKEAALQRAVAEIDQYSNPIVEGSFITNDYGYKSGQILTVNIPSRNIDSQYIIRQVTTISLGNGLFEYEVTFANKLKGLNDFLMYLFDNGKKIFERTDETLSVYKTLLDNFYVSDSAPSYSKRDIVASPYVYSNDSGTTVGKGQYNKAQYG